MSFDLGDIYALYLTQPWWVWVGGFFASWTGLKWLRHRIRSYVERPIATKDGFEQRRVRVDYNRGTIRLPHGDTFPVSKVRGLRWEDISHAGRYLAYIELEDMKRPIRPVSFSSSQRPEEFVSRLRTAIERAGGAKFSVRASDHVEIMGQDYSNPITAAVAKKVVEHGRRVVWGPSK